MLRRLVCYGPVIGLSIALPILVLIGVIKLFSGDLELFRMLPQLAIFAVVVLGLYRFAIPSLNRRLQEESRAQASADLAIPLLDEVNEFPLGAIRAPIGGELAQALDLSDEEWWGEHANKIRRHVRQILAALGNASSLIPVEAEWAVPLLNAIARAGRTEYLPPIERLASRENLTVSNEIRLAVAACAESLREKSRRDREAATLLRTAQGGSDLLVRPVAGETDTDETILLRPAENDELQVIPVLASRVAADEPSEHVDQASLTQT